VKHADARRLSSRANRCTLNSYQTARMPDTEHNPEIIGVREDKQPGKDSSFGID